MPNLSSDTEIYKNTYGQLVRWVKELLWAVQRYSQLEDLNIKQVNHIMELEQDLRMLKLVVNNDDEEQPRPALQPDWIGPDGTDWLSPMKWGTEFKCRWLEGPPWLVREYTHGGKLKGDVLLIPTMTMNDTSTWLWVEPVAFCRAFELRGILKVPEDDN